MAPQAKTAENSKEPSAIAKSAQAVGAAIMTVMKAVFDDTFFNWLAHGSTELANMVLHGHAAPVYSHSRSPAHAETGQAAPANDIAPQTEQSVTSPEPKQLPANVVEKYLPAVPEGPESQAAQSMAVSQEMSPGESYSLVERQLENLQESPELERDEQELSR